MVHQRVLELRKATHDLLTLSTKSKNRSFSERWHRTSYQIISSIKWILSTPRIHSRFTTWFFDHRWWTFMKSVYALNHGIGDEECQYQGSDWAKRPCRIGLNATICILICNSILSHDPQDEISSSWFPMEAWKWCQWTCRVLWFAFFQELFETWNSYTHQRHTSPLTNW